MVRLLPRGQRGPAVTLREAVGRVLTLRFSAYDPAVHRSWRDAPLDVGIGLLLLLAILVAAALWGGR